MPMLKREASPDECPVVAIKREASPKPEPEPSGIACKRSREDDASDTDTPASLAPPATKKRKSGVEPNHPDAVAKRNRLWTPDELEALLLAAVAGVSAKKLDGSVPGRTPKQCIVTWQNTVVPFLRRALRDKGKKAA